MLTINYDEKMDVVEIRGHKYLFTDFRVDKESLPKGAYAYEVRESDEGSEPCEISEHILVNFYGTIISKAPIKDWDEERDGRHFIYLEFEDTPAYYEDYETGEIVEEPFDKDGESNFPYYYPKQEEWNYLCDETMSLNEYLSVVSQS